MSNARLLSITLERFKSYDKATTIPLSPLTVVLGKNNSGKSSIIQALLLLKQTLALPRPEVPLHLQGALFDALSLREVTYGWPAPADYVEGPRIVIRWSSTIDTRVAWERAGWPDKATFMKNTGLEWMRGIISQLMALQCRVTELELAYAEVEGRTVLYEVRLRSFAKAEDREPECRFTFKREKHLGLYSCWFNGQDASKLYVGMDHFLPNVSLDRSDLGPRSKQRTWFNAFLLLFSQPINDLKAILSGFGYLGAMRTPPATLYRPDPVPPEEIGVNAEYAAQMLHARRSDRVHYLPPLRIEGGEIKVPSKVRAKNLEDAINEVLLELGVDVRLKVDEVKDVGFRLFFGQASLQHVGRGLSYLLPVIQLGLVADPLRFDPILGDSHQNEYDAACRSYSHIATEEGDAHLHPKVQSRLAHWLVALAMARRQLIVETHSDHLVRRLRGLAARAKPGSDLEKWLLENVNIVKVEQHEGMSTAETVRLTPQGSLEDWPAEFMDEATDEERAIYDASLDKPAGEQGMMPELGTIEHDVGDEPDLGP
ncbi:MAG: AAA family ATPase [Polyangiaceae bacterium]|nr:AAA family ATPase [Polyangiaceae bacterium]